MILVDSSVWTDHLRSGDDLLAHLLARGEVLVHPFVIGELALGQMRRRGRVLDALQQLPLAVVARELEVLRLIEHYDLSGAGIGYVDAHLLAATRLSADARLWTRDRRLAAVAERLSLAAQVAH